MRSIRVNEKYEESFNEAIKPFIEYVKKHNDVILGVRDNELHFYVSGGRFFKIKYYSKLNKFEADFDENYFKSSEKEKPSKLKKLLEKGKSDNLDEWLDILDELKEKVERYQNAELGNDTVKAEKIIQQKIMHELNNNNTNYYAYDIEYQLQGLNDYIYRANHKDKIKTDKGEFRTKTLGRADIMVIGKPDEKGRITIYLVEVKHGTGAFGGVSKSDLTFGSGIAGHIKNNIAIINTLRNDKSGIYESAYRKDKFKKENEYLINVRERLQNEIKAIMKFYQDNDLIKNSNFKDIDYDKITLKTGASSAELVFFLADYENKSQTFEKYLGIYNYDYDSDFSVKKLLKNDKNLIDLYFAKPDDMFNFKYIKTNKTYKDSNFDLNFDNYKETKKEDFR